MRLATSEYIRHAALFLAHLSELACGFGPHACRVLPRTGYRCPRGWAILLVTQLQKTLTHVQLCPGRPRVLLVCVKFGV